jgi:hypothetical protein
LHHCCPVHPSWCCSLLPCCLTVEPRDCCCCLLDEASYINDKK